MFWQEETSNKPEYVVPDNIVDVCFSIRCKTLPIDHAHALSQQIQHRLPWLAEEPDAGIHLIHVAESGNGWMRPDEPGQLLHLSKRTKLTLRVPAHRTGDTGILSGQTLDIDGNALQIGTSTIRKLTATSIVFARHIINDHDTNEHDFLQRQYRALQAMDITVSKMMCGKMRAQKHPDGDLHTRSLMIADLKVEQSVLLQEKGLGPGRLFGCGLFLPHKGIAAIKDLSEQKTS